MTTHLGRSSTTDPVSHEASQEALADLVQQVELVGCYPELVLDTPCLVTGEEEILSGTVQSKTTFAEAIHRHLTILALTPNRLAIAHADDTSRDDDSPGTLATSEAVPLSRIRSMAPIRGMVDPAWDGGTLTEMTIAVSQDSVRRVDMEPAAYGDPDCQADHGMTGVPIPDDVATRVAAGMEGAAALVRAEILAGRLSQTTARTAAP